ncbi:3475_t:CDS:2 [Cetraspora pellucida]|uniref:3475_t:CDS:1 n=1 Tax=Cetraspora pellucida TaxID=1433469 RepID=A0ACA9JXL5_9GLOM|nr:3475_t:CDS:2 [Cetraspora pellucida]
MRLLTWNVNGLRSLVQYHPWCEHKNYQILLETLDADIICFQEVKLTLDRLDSSIAIIPGYDAYFSFAKGKPAYSGVVTYVKTNLITPVAAEEGITGIINQPPADMKSPFDNNQSLSDTRICSEISDLTTNELLDLDSEGRCVILDFKMFILFNLYCPHESSVERLPFKMNFYKILQARVEALLRAGRQVIILGDMNVTHKEIDHCDPQRSVREYELESFDDHPARKWFDGFVTPNGPMGLVKWFKSCSVEQQIMGSDHCPVVGELYDEIEEDGHKYIFRNELNLSININNEKPETPRLCAKYLPKFNGSQRTLKNFFSKASTKDDNSQSRNGSDVIKTPCDNLSKSKNADFNIENFRKKISKSSKNKLMMSKPIKFGGHKQRQKSVISSNQSSLISYFKQSTQTESSSIIRTEKECNSKSLESSSNAD